MMVPSSAAVNTIFTNAPPEGSPRSSAALVSTKDFSQAGNENAGESRLGLATENRSGGT